MWTQIDMMHYDEAMTTKRIEITGLSANGQQLMFVRDVDASGSMFFDNVSDALSFMRARKTGYRFTDNYKWSTRKINAFLWIERIGSSTVVHRFNSSGVQTENNGNPC